MVMPRILPRTDLTVGAFRSNDGLFKPIDDSISFADAWLFCMSALHRCIRCSLSGATGDPRPQRLSHKPSRRP